MTIGYKQMVADAESRIATITASEALQCPTLLNNGFGSHRIEGIGDKHVPWIHNAKNTDLVTAIDDEATTKIIRLFNTEAGHKYLAKQGVSSSDLGRLNLLGISSIANLLSSIKVAKYYEMTAEDVILTVATDSMDMYQSRLVELQAEEGDFLETDAAAVYHRYLVGENTDNMLELSYYERKRIHNLKYYTWVEQQGKSFEEIQAQWYEPDYWTSIQPQTEAIDNLITEFNGRVGLI